MRMGTTADVTARSCETGTGPEPRSPAPVTGRGPLSTRPEWAKLVVSHRNSPYAAAELTRH